jgi:hypothetical protein
MKVLVTTLEGWVLCFHKNEFEILWQINLNYPIFSGPVINTNGNWESFWAKGEEGCFFFLFQKA